MKWKDAYYNDKIALDYFISNNFGDKLNENLIEKISGNQVVNIISNFDFSNKSVYACIGSTLQKKFKYPTQIWGAGAMYSDRKINLDTISRIHAIRGALSRQLLIRQGRSCPEIYGDPAILLPYYYNFNVVKTHSIGIIPHYLDKDSEFVKFYSNTEDIKIIDICKDTETVIKDVLSCINVISSSLHGLIVADTYGINSLWVEFSDNVKGNGFKFRDYYTGINYKPYNPLQLRNSRDVSMYQIEMLMRRDIEITDKMRNKLLEACPFI